MFPESEDQLPLRQQIPSSGIAPTHPRLLAWLDEVVELCKPARIHYCDGSLDEADHLARELIEAGSLVRLNDDLVPNSYYARTDPDGQALAQFDVVVKSPGVSPYGEAALLAAAPESEDQPRPLVKLQISSVGGTVDVLRRICLSFALLHGPVRESSPGSPGSTRPPPGASPCSMR